MTEEWEKKEEENMLKIELAIQLGVSSAFNLQSSFFGIPYQQVTRLSEILFFYLK